jgi:hypothetical protein
LEKECRPDAALSLTEFPALAASISFGIGKGVGNPTLPLFWFDGY